MDRCQNNGSVKECPHAIAQRLAHRAIAVSTALLGQSHKDNVRYTAVEEQPEAKEVLTRAAQLHLPTHDLFWAEGPAPPRCS